MMEIFGIGLLEFIVFSKEGNSYLGITLSLPRSVAKPFLRFFASVVHLSLNHVSDFDKPSLIPRKTAFQILLIGL
ncbi:hypothetical protein L1887_11418 [Cichorium endivia]|nr:hypothetical protein L1887_11418 [Cichorium endivia]